MRTQRNAMKTPIPIPVFSPKSLGIPTNTSLMQYIGPVSQVFPIKSLEISLPGGLIVSDIPSTPNANAQDDREDEERDDWA